MTAIWVNGASRIWRLTKWELYKIISRKLVWFAAACLIVLPWMWFISAQTSGSPISAALWYEPHTRPPTARQYQTAERGSSVVFERLMKVRGQPPAALMREFNGDNAIIQAVTARRQVQGVIADARQQSLRSASGSFAHKAATIELHMMGRLPAPGWGDTSFTGLMYSASFSDGLGYILLGLVIILAITPVWPNERTSGVHRLLRGAALGRRETVLAKVAAAMLFGFMVAIVYGISNFSVALATTGLTDWSSPLASSNGFFLSPYDLAIGPYFFLTIAWQVLGCGTLALLTLLTSAVSRSLLVGAGLALLLYMAPAFVISLQNATLDKLLQFDPSWAIRSAEMYETFRVVDVLGQPVLYPLAMLIALVLGILLLTGVVGVTWMRAEPE